MPPHCDSLDGPVASAARTAIERVNVFYALPWVPKESEDEVREAFEHVMHAREQQPDARRVADRWFIETVVRLHRVGEGSSYEGLRPAGADPGPAVRLAERAIADGDAEELGEFLEEEMEDALESMLERVLRTAKADPRDTAAMRRHVREKLAFLRLAEEIHRLLSGGESHGHVRAAEETAKRKLRDSYARRHRDTVAALAQAA